MTTTYDFIIIGGGVAGLVLANRLSENAAVKILVIEAGKNYLNDQTVNLPAAWPMLLETPADWDLQTTPQAGLNDRVMTLPQGCALGGSSAINSSVFTIPSRASIDAWASLGNTGWDWKALAPYLRKTHTLTKPSEDDFAKLDLHNKFSTDAQNSGFLQVSFPSGLDSPFQHAWNETFENLGFGSRGNIDNGTIFGSYSNPAAIHPISKKRSYAAVAYYEPIQDRANLTVLTEATATKILFEGESPNLVATEVEFTHKGEVKKAKASKEVILAAGAIHSPLLLELSGIGSPEILQAHKIPVLVANPNVGENLQDPIISGVSYEVVDGIETIDDIGRGNPQALGKAMAEYMTTQSGPLSRAAVTSTSLVPVAESEEEIKNLLDAYPATSSDPAYHAFVRSLLGNPKQSSGMVFMYSAQANYGANSAKRLTAAELPGNFVTISTMLLNPLSTGHVHISGNSTANPVLDFKYFTHPLDAEMMARHLSFLDKLTTTDPFASLLKPNGKRNRLYTPWKNLDEIKQYIRKTGLSNWHPVGTLSMLPQEKGGVVGTDLKVYGVKNLRVVDASVFPVIPHSNIQSVVYAVAERAADLIKAEY